MGQYKYVFFSKSVPALKGSERITHEREHEIQRENYQKQFAMLNQPNAQTRAHLRGLARVR